MLFPFRNKDESIGAKQFFEMLLHFANRKQPVAMIFYASPNLRRTFYNSPTAEIATEEFV